MLGMQPAVWLELEKGAKVQYKPLPSVWDGEDAELIELMLAFYPRNRPKRILDATVNGGRFWRGSKRKIVGFDIAQTHRPSGVGSKNQNPFAKRRFYVVVYDPPHLPKQGEDDQKKFTVRFLRGGRSPKEH